MQRFAASPVVSDLLILCKLGYENSKNRLGTAEKDSAAPGLFYFVLSVRFVAWT